MNNKFSIIAIATMWLAFITTACNKKDDVLHDIKTTSAYSEFATPNLTVTTNSYFIKNDPNSTFKIPVGITNISNVDRKIVFKDSSRTAVAGIQYNFVNTITIPAGKAADSIIVQGLYTGYPVGRKDTLYVKIVGGDVPVNAYNNVYAVTLQGYCDVVSNNLTGSYTKSVDYYNSSASATKYTAQIVNWVSTGTTSATVNIINLGATPDNGWGPFSATDPVTSPGIKVNLDWSNPANFTVTVPSQNFFNDGSGMSTISGSGSFSACANTFTIKFTTVYAGDKKSYVTTSILNR